MKASSATSARATAPRLTGRSSDRPPPSPTSAEGFVLSGPSRPPDPEFNAYRNDLADVRLAGSVIASHYAEAAERKILAGTPLRATPAEDGKMLLELHAGDRFWMLDDSLGWAWGYGGNDRRVGYVKSGDVGAD